VNGSVGTVTSLDTQSVLPPVSSCTSCASSYAQLQWKKRKTQEQVRHRPKSSRASYRCVPSGTIHCLLVEVTGGAIVSKCVEQVVKPYLRTHPVDLLSGCAYVECMRCLLLRPVIPSCGVSVSMSVTHLHPWKMDERLEVLFGVKTLRETRNAALSWSQSPAQRGVRRGNVALLYYIQLFIIQTFLHSPGGAILQPSPNHCSHCYIITCCWMYVL